MNELQLVILVIVTSYAIGVIVGYQCGKDVWRCRRYDRCVMNSRDDEAAKAGKGAKE